LDLFRGAWVNRISVWTAGINLPFLGDLSRMKLKKHQMFSENKGRLNSCLLFKNSGDGFAERMLYMFLFVRCEYIL
jgi:hypothetical protein